MILIIHFIDDDIITLTFIKLTFVVSLLVIAIGSDIELDIGLKLK